MTYINLTTHWDIFFSGYPTVWPWPVMEDSTPNLRVQTKCTHFRLANMNIRCTHFRIVIFFA